MNESSNNSRAFVLFFSGLEAFGISKRVHTLLVSAGMAGLQRKISSTADILGLTNPSIFRIFFLL